MKLARWKKEVLTKNVVRKEFLRKNAFYLYLVFFGLSSGVLRPLLPLYFRDLGFTVVEWSVLSSVFAVGLTVSEAFWGVLSDRIGRKIILGLAPLILFFIIPSYTLTVILPMFLLLQFFRGSIFSASLPTSKAYVSDTMSPRRLGTAMGLWIASINSGRIIGSILGPYFSDNWTYTAAFSLSACAALTSSLIAFIFLGEPNRKKRIEYCSY